jgi:GT2 family glycosyltransferase
MGERSAAAVIVVNYRSSALLRTHLGSLSTDAPWLDVVVVDSFSDDTERAAVSALCDAQGWTLVALDDNAGFGGGVNAGAAVATARGAEVLLVLNPDASLSGEAAELLVAAAARTGALVAPRIERPDGRLWTEGVDLYLDDGTMAGVRRRSEHEGRPRMMWVSGACFAISRALWERIGGFDDDYFLYWEDVDLSRKVHDAGGGVIVLPDAVAVHDEGATHDDRTSGRAKSETYYYFNVRNRLLFARRHLGPDDVKRWRRSTLRVSWGIILQGGRRQLLTSIAPWRALARGIRDGRRGVTGPLPG